MVKKAIIYTLFSGLLVGGLIFGTRYYRHKKEQQRRAKYYENLKDTSSPTVTVLKDSILIPYLYETRTIHIYTPPEYKEDTLTNYPVIYMLDGESSFNDLASNGPEWQIDEVINKASQEGKQTAIVVGISEAENRDREYTPYPIEGIADAQGQKFANWVATDLRKWVNTNYRALEQPENTIIGGISRSGMMAYYMFMQHPDVFGKALIQSPAMWVDYDRLMNLELKKSALAKKKIFVSVGEREGRLMNQHARDIYHKFKRIGLDEDQLRFEQIPKEGHWHLTWRKSFAMAYQWLVSD